MVKLSTLLDFPRLNMSSNSQPANRGTIFSEQAEIISHEHCEGGQHILRLNAPKTAAHARAGNFVHLQCGPHLPMRRPMSIMRASETDGWIDILYKVHGDGTRLLSERKTGQPIDLLGPIGKSFKLEAYKKKPLLIGGGVGIPPMVYLAEHMKKSARSIKPFVIMGSEIPFPFKRKPSQIMIPGIPADVIAAMPLLEDWGITSRLTSLQAYPGCFEGYVTDLARLWLNSLADEINDVEIFSCGPTPMLKAVAHLAQEYGLPCQVSLEEFMACAVGGCAGCAVLVHAEEGSAMKRVCVDGPVFEGRTVFPA